MSRFDDGTEIVLTFDTSSELPQLSLIREDPKTHEKTIFVSYTFTNEHRGNMELFKFRIEKQTDHNQKSITKKVTTIRSGIKGRISFNPSLEIYRERETRTEEFI